MANLGFIGLGTMGGRVARRLLGAGHTVHGYNRTKAKADDLIQSGLQWHDSPREVAAAADVVFSMVNDTASLEAITGGPEGVLAGLSAGKVYVDMTTVSPNFSRELARQVEDQGADFLEAPVSGSVGAVEGGTLVFFAGGKAEVLEKVRPYLGICGQKIIHMGGHGAALAMKIALNINLGAQLVAFAECVLLAERAGIDRDAAIEAVLNSVAASPFMKYKTPAIKNLPEEVWFSLKMYQKDLNLALALGRELGVPLFSAATANELATIGQALGLGSEDFAAYFHVVQRLAAQDHS